TRSPVSGVSLGCPLESFELRLRLCCYIAAQYRGCNKKRFDRQRPVRPTNEFRPILPPRLKANKALLFPFTGTSMIRKFGRAIIILALLNGAPAYAFTNPLSSLQVASFNLLERGPLADFLDVFREQAIPRRVVAWRRGQGPGTVVISTTERRLYYVL